MARPIKQGLDYFPLDTNMDDNFELIEAKYGLEGFGVLIKLYQRAYKECGYFYPWTEKEQLLFSKRVNVDNNTVNNIIVDAVTYGIFDKRLYDKGILTSHGMQKRYIEATIRRKEITMFLDIMLINVDDIPVNVGKNPRKIILVEYISTQSKRNEMKRNEIESKSPGTENAPGPVFSKAEALNPNTQNQEQRFQQIKTAWNANCKPPCNIRSTLTMSYTQRDEWIAGESQIVDIFATCKAIQNYGGILGNPEYEIDGHKGYSMLSFLIKGVGWYTDEAKPFERCKKKQAAKPDKASSVEVPDAERTREYLDSLRAEGVEEAGVFEFDAAKAMEEIRARGAG